jgi:glycosyltransferase involved in cell wall biosynthesis
MQSDQRLKLALIADFPEERWESMDLVADMVELHLKSDLSNKIEVHRITPRYQPLFSRLSRSRLAWNLDRLINRRIILKNGISKTIASDSFDMALIVDHSYANIVPVLKQKRLKTQVICHDTDALKPLNNSSRSLKNRLRRWFARPIESGLRNADCIICDSETVRQELIHDWSFPPESIHTIPIGVAPEFHLDNSHDQSLMRADLDGKWPVLVHVGTNTPRKRLDLLISTVSALSSVFPNLTCIRIGGGFNRQQKQELAENRTQHYFQVMPRLSRSEIAAIYRAASLVLITSDAEGFGLPMVEALSCGSRVLSTDLPVLREVGGEFATYTPPGDLKGMIRNASQMLNEKSGDVNQESLRAFLSKYSWSHYVHELSYLMEQLKS